MRMSVEEKEKSHRRIVASAARMFRESGLDGVSVADIMGDAGLTHGGFYKHFDSKEALIASALDAAIAEVLDALDQGDPAAAFAAYRASYLSAGHLTHPGMGCPVAALAGDVARWPHAIKDTLGQGIRRLVGAIARAMRGSQAARDRAAMREFAMLVGAVVIARASDEQTAREMLAAVRGEQAPGGGGR